MREVNADLAVLQFGKPHELKAVIVGDRLEHWGGLRAKRLNRFQKYGLDCVRSMVFCFQPDGISGLSLHERQHTGFVFFLAANYGVDFPVSEFFPQFHTFWPLFYAFPKLLPVCQPTGRRPSSRGCGSKPTLLS